MWLIDERVYLIRDSRGIKHHLRQGTWQHKTSMVAGAAIWDLTSSNHMQEAEGVNCKWHAAFNLKACLHQCIFSCQADPPNLPKQCHKAGNEWLRYPRPQGDVFHSNHYTNLHGLGIDLTRVNEGMADTHAEELGSGWPCALMEM